MYAILRPDVLTIGRHSYPLHVRGVQESEFLRAPDRRAATNRLRPARLSPPSAGPMERKTDSSTWKPMMIWFFFEEQKIATGLA